MSVLIEEINDNCVSIRLSAGITNVLTTTLKELSSAIKSFSDNDKGIIICGGDKFFSNGVDLDWALSQNATEMRNMFLELGECVLSILESFVPIVGAAKGHAVGGGLAIFLACDYRYASIGHVLLGKPEILLGVPNPYYGDQLLRFVAGDYVASDLIYSGQLINSEEALRLNLIHGTDDAKKVEQLACDKLALLKELNNDAFSESKHMRTGQLTTEIRRRMSARVARQVEIWNSAASQKKLREAASKLNNRLKN